MRLRLALLIVLGSLLSASCATYRDQLVVAQAAFERNEHERSLALLRDLEPDLPRLTTSDQAQYAYLRGMTDYRIGYRADARHWLAIARAFDEASPGILPVAFKQRTVETLAELDGIVQANGYAALGRER